jgi:hypothetical protein
MQWFFCAGGINLASFFLWLMQCGREKYLRSLIEKSLPPCGQCCQLLVGLSGLFGEKIGHEEKKVLPSRPAIVTFLKTF